MSTCIAVTDSVERWDVFEIALEGKTAGNHLSTEIGRASCRERV